MTSVPTNHPKYLDALWMAYTLHQKQTDKANAPYIFHPYNVACRVAEYFERYPVLNHVADKGVCIIAALLHDTIEDTAYTWEQMNERFGVAVADLVECLTKTKKKEINDYYVRISEVPAALIVKLADLSDNLRTNRIISPTEKDAQRAAHYRKRYAQLIKKFNYIVGASGKC